MSLAVTTLHNIIHLPYTPKYLTKETIGIIILAYFKYRSIISLHPARPLVTNYHARRSYLEYRTILPTHDAIVKKNNNKKYGKVLYYRQHMYNIIM